MQPKALHMKAPLPLLQLIALSLACSPIALANQDSSCPDLSGHYRIDDMACIGQLRSLSVSQIAYAALGGMVTDLGAVLAVQQVGCESLSLAEEAPIPQQAAHPIHLSEAQQRPDGWTRTEIKV